LGAPPGLRPHSPQFSKSREYLQTETLGSTSEERPLEGVERGLAGLGRNPPQSKDASELGVRRRDVSASRDQESREDTQYPSISMGQKDPNKSINRNERREDAMTERYRNITISPKDLTDASSQGKPERELGPDEIFITSPQLKRGVGTGLIDTGAQVSLVEGGSLEGNIPAGKYREINMSIQGIYEGDMHIKKGIMM
jgi:hypothetical protein